MCSSRAIRKYTVEYITLIIIFNTIMVISIALNFHSFLNDSNKVEGFSIDIQWAFEYDSITNTQP